MNLALATDLTAFLDQHLTEQEQQRRRVPKHVHASGIMNCQRMQVYGLLGTKPDSLKSDPRWARAANLGDKTHELIAEYFRSAGILEAEEMPIPDNDWHISGRVDYIIKWQDERVIVDAKSMDSGKYESYHGSEKQRAAYAQIQIYLAILKLKWGKILSFNRDKCQWQEYDVRYEEAHAKWLLDRAAAITMYVAEGIIPPYDVVKPHDCYFCPFQGRCDRDEAQQSGEVA